MRKKYTIKITESDIYDILIGLEIALCDVTQANLKRRYELVSKRLNKQKIDQDNNEKGLNYVKKTSVKKEKQRREKRKT